MSTNQIEKELTEVFESFARFIGSVLMKTFKGLRRTRTLASAIGLVLTVLFALGAFKLKAELFSLLGQYQIAIWAKYALLIFLLVIPIIYLYALEDADEKRQKKYEKMFKEIEFKGRNGQYPIFIKKIIGKKKGRKSKKYKITYLFKSTIPMKEWISSKERLETAFDCNILRFAEGSSKRMVKMVTVPSECRIPEMVHWDDKNILPEDGEMIVGEGAIEKVTFNLNRTPHAIIAGETGSGKSVILHTLLWQMIKKGARNFMIDFKGGVEFSKKYEQYGEVITDRNRALAVLEMICHENDMRLKLFRELDVKNLPEFNKKTGKNLCRIGIFCDEIAEMLDKKGVSKEEKPLFEQLEGKISSLARLSRATGINLFMGVQRPDANVLTGQIKNNMPIRISGRFADKPASEIVLGNSDAVYLPDIKGRFLFRLGNEITEFQAYLFDDDLHLKDIDLDEGEMLIEKENATQEVKELIETEKEIKIENSLKPKEKKKAEVKKQREQIPQQECVNEKLDFDFSWSCEEGKE